MSTAPSSNKYVLKSIEDDIELFDRKIAHLHKFEVFSSDDDRLVAASKLSAKRDRLVRTLRELTDPAPVADASATAAKKPAKKASNKTKISTRSKGVASAKETSVIEAGVATQAEAVSETDLATQLAV